MDLYCLFMAEWRFDCIIYFCGSSVEERLDLSVAFLLLTLTQSGLLLLVKKRKDLGCFIRNCNIDLAWRRKIKSNHF